jgi:hypothetical protein
MDAIKFVQRRESWMRSCICNDPKENDCSKAKKSHRFRGEISLAAKSEHFNTQQRFIKEISVNVFMEHKTISIYKSDSVITHSTRSTIACVRRGTLNRKGCLYVGKICTGLALRCPNEFPARQNTIGNLYADYRYQRDLPSVMLGTLMDSDYFACASDTSDTMESEKLRCIYE